LIGYDRQLSRGQNVNEGKIGAGYTLTAFYEAVPVRQSRTTANTVTQTVAVQPEEALLSANLQFRTGANQAMRFVESVVRDNGSTFNEAPQDLKFAAAVAEFGMILRDSEYKGNGTLQQVLEWAQEGKGADVNGYCTDFIELVRKAQALKRG